MVNHPTKLEFPIQLSSEFLLRPIEKSDNEQVARLIRTVMTEYDCVGEGYSINDPEVDHMFETYDHAHSAFFVIENGEGKIVGSGGVGPLENGEPHICELKKMYFYTILRGKGFGKTMVDLCLESAREKGYNKCYLETVKRMEKANRLYQKMGFMAM